MKSFLSKHWHRLLIFLSVMGPGLIVAIADNDAGGVATYTVAASLYGMASQYFIIPTTLLLALTQWLGARIAIATNKGLAGLIRERYGIKISFFMFILYFITNQGVVLQNEGGLKSALKLLHLPWQLLLVLISFFLIFVVIKFDYKRIQKLFMFMILFYFSYVVSAVLAHPNWPEAIQESFIFPRKVSIFNLGYLFSAIAVLGTTITAWGQFFINSYIVDKRLTIANMQDEKIEIVLGSIITNFFSWMMALAVSYTLFIHAIPVTGGEEAAKAIIPFAGNFASALFAVGLFAASMLGLTIVPLATAYAFAEFFGYEGSLNVSFKRGGLFYGLFIIQIIAGLLITLAPNISLFQLTLYADYLNGAMLPIIFFFLIKFSENKEIMGKYTSRGVSSFFLRAAAAIISLAVVVTFAEKLLRLA